MKSRNKEDANRRPFRILSIDGGGILGLYSAEVLKLIRDRYFPNASFSASFELLAGTSTGGIIALALGLGRVPDDISHFYRKYGPEIFPRRVSSSKVRSFLKSLFGTRYSSEPLVKRAREFFGEHCMRDSKAHLCIPAIDVVNAKGVVFKTPHGKDLWRDRNTKMWQVAVATSSAPTYFPIFTTDEWEGLVDGGLWQNNPALIAMIEAHRYFLTDDSEYDRLHVLSIGNPLTRVPKSMPFGTSRSSLFEWNSKLIELPMKVSSKAVDDVLSFLMDFGALKVERYFKVASSDIGEATSFLAMDNASNRALKWMTQRARHDFDQSSRQLDDFFQS